jgi:MarR family transcriptional regulator, transcriptional regulator for hemolysin
MAQQMRELGFLLSDVARALRTAVDQRARRIGMTRAQWALLYHIERIKGARQVDLADLMELEPMTVARLIDRLEAAGCVERRPDPADRRAKRIYLTKKAGPMLEQLRAIGDELMAETLGALTPAQRTQLFDLLTTLKGSLMEAAGRTDRDRLERASA